MVHDLSNEAGLKAFNTHMEDKSYVNGYIPTTDDFKLLAEVKEAPNAKFVNALRWFNHVSSFSAEEKAAAKDAPVAAEPAEAKEEEDDDDFDCFGDDDDEEHEAEIQRIADAAAAAKAAKGKVVIAKSVVVLDVKPWDTETDLKALEDKIRSIEMEGLEWKNAELKPVAYGLKKIVIMCHIVDTQVSVDDLQEKIGEFDDDVQSTDVVTFTKL